MVVQTVKHPPVLTADLQYDMQLDPKRRKVVLRLLTMAGQSVLGGIIFKPTDNVNKTFLPKIEKALAKGKQWTEAL